MISWTIWKALQHPPQAHPLFRLGQGRETRRIGRFLALFLGVVLLLLGYRAIELKITFIALLSTITPPLVLSVFGIGIVLYVTNIALTINSAIHRVHDAKIYDLLCLTPPGRFNATWAISTGSVYRKTAPESVYFAIQFIASLFIAAMLVCLTIILLVLLLGGFERWAELLYAPALEFSNLLALGLAFYLGSVQAAASGIMVGMLVPTYIHEAALSDLLTIGVFLGIQGFIYLLATLLTTLIFPALLRTFSLTGWLATVSLPFLSLGAFAVMQERLNLTLWRLLARRLNTALEPDGRFPNAIDR